MPQATFVLKVELSGAWTNGSSMARDPVSEIRNGFWNRYGSGTLKRGPGRSVPGYRVFPKSPAMSSSPATSPHGRVRRGRSAASFDRDGDGCPRGGAFELSAEGVVIGQLSFTDAGGVTLTPVSGPPITFGSCNDPALLLTKTCPINNQM